MFTILLLSFFVILKDQLLDDLLGGFSQPMINQNSKISTELLNSLYSTVVTVDEPLSNIDILITEPTNEKDDNNIVPDGMFNLKHEIPYDQSRPHSPIYIPPVVENFSENESIIREFSIPAYNELELEQSRPVTPSIPRPTSVSPSIARSRPVSPSVAPVQFTSIKQSSAPTIKTYTNTQNKQDSSSSEEEDQKFQIRIRPRPQKVTTPGETFEVAPLPIPLLPRPPKSIQEIEEFRQRRNSSGAASITHSLKDESSEDEITKYV